MRRNWGRVQIARTLVLLLAMFVTTVSFHICEDENSLDLVDSLSLSHEIQTLVKRSGVLFSELLEMSENDLVHVVGIGDVDAWRLRQQLTHLMAIKCPDVHSVSRSNAKLARTALQNIQREVGSRQGEQTCVRLIKEWYGEASSRAPSFLSEEALDRRLGHCWGGSDGVPLLCLPSAQLVGYSQSGSTALGFLLSKHPQVGDQLGNARTKESNFFRQPGAHRSPIGYDWEQYSRRFLAAIGDDDNILAIDGSPDHVYNNPMTPLLMKCHMPWTRIIVILRDPMVRLLSTFRAASMITKARRKGWLDVDRMVCFGESNGECFKRQPLEVWLHLGMEGIHDLCDRDRAECGFRSIVDDEWLDLQAAGKHVQYPRSFPLSAKHWHLHHDPRHSVSSFFHGLHLSQWLTVFHHSDIHVVFQQDLLKDRAGVMRKLEDFLHLDAWGNESFDPYLSRSATEQSTWIARPEESPNQRSLLPRRAEKAFSRFLSDDDAILRGLLSKFWNLAPPWEPLGTPHPAVCEDLRTLQFASSSCGEPGMGKHMG